MSEVACISNWVKGVHTNMNDRERLIELIKNSLKKNIGKSCQLAENIADDLLEHGVTVPPYKIGVMVYFIFNDEITFSAINRIVAEIKNDMDVEYYISLSGLAGMFSKEMIGKRIFLTREEAEKALKGK